MIDDVFCRPPAHGRITNWLGPQMVSRLLAFAYAQRNKFEATSVLNKDKGQNEIDLATRRSLKFSGLGKLESELRANARAALPQICRQLGATQFEPSGISLELVAHGDGAFFDEHVDLYTGSRGSSPPISAIYYFHRIPKSFSGGVLRIYPIAGRDRSKAFIEIEPANDSLVFFPGWFPHEILPVKCPSGQFEDSRFAVNIHPTIGKRG